MGVGKTLLINNMINTLLEENQIVYGSFEFDTNGGKENKFANLISISFSAFDDSEPRPEKMDKTKGIQYSYIGLKQIQSDKDKPIGTKSTTKLKYEFIKSLEYCRRSKQSEMEKRN